MGRITYDHFCLLIFGQGNWKEKFIKDISKETKTSFFHLSGYSKNSLFCTCPICNALIKLFDPMNSGQFVEICDLCKALYGKFERFLHQEILGGEIKVVARIRILIMKRQQGQCQSSFL